MANEKMQIYTSTDGVVTLEGSLERNRNAAVQAVD